MAITYTLEARSKYLYFSGAGSEEGLAENLRIHEMIVKACKEHNCHRVLVDDRNVIYTASMLSLYQLVKRYAEMDSPTDIERAALVIDPAYLQDNLFFETAAQNRGINLRVFDDIENAITWLTT